MRRLGVSTLLAILVTIVVAVAASLALYSHLSGMLSASQAAGPELLTVDAIRASSCIISVSVRNTGSMRVLLKNSSLVILDSEGKLATIGGLFRAGPKLNPSEVWIGPGSTLLLSYAVDRALFPGSYTVKILGSGGSTAAYSIKLREGTSYSCHVANVTVNNGEDNKIVFEDDYTRYEFWQTLDGGNYKVWFRVYAKPGVTIEYVYGEMWARDGEHPDWAGGNPWEWATQYTYPDYAGAEWYPVREDEMPVVLLFKVRAS